ncbi:hypothetical protein D9M73_259980 [compost metagenome]
MLDHQHAPLLTQGRKLRTEETAEIHDGQQAATHVGHALHPVAHAGQQGIAGLMEHLADLPHGRHEQAPGHTKTNAVPGLHHLALGRQARRQMAAALIDIDEKLEGTLDLRHAGPGLF